MPRRRLVAELKRDSTLYRTDRLGSAAMEITLDLGECPDLPQFPARQVLRGDQPVAVILQGPMYVVRLDSNSSQ